MKDKTIAAILALFLGGLGVHRFYLGQAGLGILYLIFCWTIIPGVIALIDFIVFLVMSKKDFDAKYNRSVLSSNQSQPIHQVVTINNVVPVSSDKSTDIVAEIEKMHALKEKGLLSEHEFEQSKRKLLQGEHSPNVTNEIN